MALLPIPMDLDRIRQGVATLAEACRSSSDGLTDSDIAHLLRAYAKEDRNRIVTLARRWLVVVRCTVERGWDDPRPRHAVYHAAPAGLRRIGGGAA